MRNQQHAYDYNHIRLYGMIMGYDAGFIKDQQQLAMIVNAPADTCDIAVNGTITRFYDLPKETRRQFDGVIINKPKGEIK